MARAVALGTDGAFEGDFHLGTDGVARENDGAIGTLSLAVSL